jgi:hypothetical protein
MSGAVEMGRRGGKNFGEESELWVSGLVVCSLK